MENSKKNFWVLGTDDFDNFKVEFRNMENHSINKKTKDMKIYSIDSDINEDFSSFLKSSLDYQKEFKKKLENKKSNFIFKIYPKLNIFSQIQLKKDKMLTNLIKKIFGEIKLGFQFMSQLINYLKNGSFTKDIWSDLKIHYNNPEKKQKISIYKLKINDSI